MISKFADPPGRRIAQLAPIAWFRYGQGITVATGVSQWNDASGNGNNLVQASGTAQPALQADNSILFDGSNDVLKTAGFTLNQPETVYLLMKQVTWSNSLAILDGATTNTMRLRQEGSTPQIQQYAGTLVNANSNLAVGSYGVLGAVYNGASSITFVNNTSAVGPADAGAANAGGVTIGSLGGLGNYSNIQVKEVIVFPTAHDSATRDIVIGYLKRVGGL